MTLHVFTMSSREPAAAAGHWAVGMALLASLLTACGEDPTANVVGQGSTASAYSTNADGLTYGSGRGVLPEDEPELIAVIGDEGLRGYVRKSELDRKTNANPPDPETALRRQKVLVRFARHGALRVRVVSVDGEPIDWLTLDPGDGPSGR